MFQKNNKLGIVRGIVLNGGEIIFDLHQAKQDVYIIVTNCETTELVKVDIVEAEKGYGKIAFWHGDCRYVLPYLKPKCREVINVTLTKMQTSFKRGESIGTCNYDKVMSELKCGRQAYQIFGFCRELGRTVREKIIGIWRTNDTYYTFSENGYCYTWK